MLAVSETSLSRAVDRLGLDLSASSSDKILKIKEFFRFYGRAMNLTGATEGDHVERQIEEALHAVALARRLELTGRWLDIGSGGGFPGLVLAACLDLEFVFVEPRAKRASALELALAKIGRPDVRVLRGRIEGGQWQAIEGQALDAGFDVAGARAVFSPARWVEEGTPWVRPGGVLCLHLRAGDPVPEGVEVNGRVEGEHWAAVGVRVPRGTGD